MIHLCETSARVEPQSNNTDADIIISFLGLGLSLCRLRLSRTLSREQRAGRYPSLLNHWPPTLHRLPG